MAVEASLVSDALITPVGPRASLTLRMREAGVSKKMWFVSVSFPVRVTVIALP
jgi:hypothetical protein